MKLKIVTMFLAVSTMISGCVVGPDYRVPDTQLPDSWHETAVDGLAAGDANVRQWWEVFEDDTLNALIERAAEGNLDVRMAILRIRQARALRGIAAGELLPSLGGQAAYQRLKPSANGMGAGSIPNTGRGAQFANTFARGLASSTLSQGISNAVPGAAGLATPLASSVVGLAPSGTKLASAPESNLFSSGFDASWELDLFGGIQRNIESADADLLATYDDYHSVLVSLFAEVATTYIDVRSYQAEIETTRCNIKLQKETLDLTKARLSSELASDLEVHQADTNLSTTESQLPLLEAGLSTSIYRLSVLLGLEPSALSDELSKTASIPSPTKETFVGVPADVLRRRPDIAGAERRLASETAKIGVAAADLYPRLTLSGTFGFESQNMGHFFDGRSMTYGLGPAVRWNIFDGLRNLNRIAAQEAAAHHAYVAYEQTVLLALQDVETAMVYYKREQARRDALKRAAEAAHHAADLSHRRYEDGLTDFQDVVDAERSLVSLETALVQSEGQVAVNLVALYKALGGGWNPEVVYQERYLTDQPESIKDPFSYFLSGADTGLPWDDTLPGSDDRVQVEEQED